MGKRKYGSESIKKSAEYQREYERAAERLEDKYKDYAWPKESFARPPKTAWAIKLGYTRERIKEVLSYQRYEPDLAKILGIWDFNYRDAVYKDNPLELKH